MAESFEYQDLSGAEFWGVELRGATFRDVDLTGAKLTRVFLVDVDIDALVDRVVINGVDITDYVNERDPWYPLRAQIRSTEPQGMRAALAAMNEAWAVTIAKASELPEAKLHEQVNGEFSFVETLRHVVFAIDKWFTVPLDGGTFHPMGLPNRGSANFPWPGLDGSAAPTFAEAVEARAERLSRFGAYLQTLQAADLTNTVEILENGPNPVQECIFTVFDEEFAHNRYAIRDLALLDAPA
jgi:DinB superfamily/Pentapeptide repeats (8 copies)